MIDQATYYVPKKPYAICIIGAGGIVHDAHLPAYAIAGYQVQGIFDQDSTKAQALATKFAIPTVYPSLEAALLHSNAQTIFDVALPATAIIPVLQQLPEGAFVLIQKPMGNNLAEAQQILAITQQKKIVAAINFQLRYAPFIEAAKQLMQQENFGAICDVEVYVNVHTPWNLWTFMTTMPRVEILYHSIHYIDLIRHLLGNPTAIYAKTVKHPQMQALASVRSNIVMDYGDMIRANILTNHCHQFGYQHQASYIKIEGTHGAIKIDLGVLIDYPHGKPDKFAYVLLKPNESPVWQTKTIQGSWFPHAFIGSMAQLLMTMDGVITTPNNSVEDSIYTMACVEAAYNSSANGGVQLANLMQ